MAAYDRSNHPVLKEAAATPSKRVLLVEGTGDISFLTLMLDKPPLRDENILADWVLAPAGGKDAVLRTIREQPDVCGMVDRDAWDEEECERIQKKHPNLFILPRFCIENFLVCPDELEEAIPGFGRLSPVISGEIPRAIRHACLWRAAQPLYEELLQAGFNRALLRYPPPKEKEMQQLLYSWQSLLSPENVEKRMSDSFARMKNLPEAVVLRRFVHGKVFWRGCVEDLIAKFYPDKKNDDLKREVYKRIKLPRDLELFLRNLFLSA